MLRVAACVKSGWTKPVKLLGVSSMLALGVVLSAASVLAEDDAAEGEYGASAHAVRPLAARNEEDATAAATVIELTERPMALESLREVMHEVPGALALSSGGYGAFSSLSLRGAEQGQTVWLLGDVPLNGPDTGAFDISLLPLAHFGRLEVYRSGAPVWLGQGSIGGVARIVPREGAVSGVNAQLGAGSFGRYELRGNGYVSRFGKRPLSLFTGVQATHAGNDFRYLDDNATRFRDDDDRERRLRNAEVLEGAGILHLRVGALRGHFDLVAHAVERVGGAPGSAGASNNAKQASRSLSRGLLSLAYTRAGRTLVGRSYRVQLLASLQGEQRRLDDPFAELALGGPRAWDNQLARVFGRFASSLELTSFLEATLLATYTGDRHSDRDAIRVSPVGPSSRHTEAVAGELRLFGRLLGLRGELRASARGEFTQTELSIVRVARPVREEQSLATPVYRLSAALEPFSGLTLRGSGGTGKRVPSITELFGDGVAMLANPELSPEHGVYADGGFVYSGLLGPACIVLEANGFWSRTHDKIVYVTDSRGFTKARNSAEAQVVGAELGAEASYRRHVRFVAASTLMRTHAEFGKQQPQQPRLKLFGRLEGSLFFHAARERLTMFASLDHASSAFFDQANTSLREPLTHVSLGAALGLLDDRIEVQARATDLFDVRGQDYQRLPLPGRAYAVLVSIREEEP